MGVSWIGLLKGRCGCHTDSVGQQRFFDERFCDFNRHNFFIMVELLVVTVKSSAGAWKVVCECGK